MFERLDPARPTLSFSFDHHVIEAVDGDTVASALLASGQRSLRRSVSGSARGPWCLMGACFECQVWIAGERRQACQTPVTDGMHVASRAPEADDE